MKTLFALALILGLGTSLGAVAAPASPNAAPCCGASCCPSGCTTCTDCCPADCCPANTCCGSCPTCCK